MHAPYPSHAALEIAATNVVAKARAGGVALRQIAFVTTSATWDKNLDVLFAYETDAELELRNADETSTALKQQFEEELESSKKVLPFRLMPENIGYSFDSHENVVRNYQGSYFLRLR